MLLQLRPEDETADNEAASITKFGGLHEDDVHRVRLDREALPSLNLDDYSGIIIGGGPYNISDPEAKKPAEQQRFEAELFTLLDQITERDFPFFGACYGIGLLAKYQGGRVAKGQYAENVEALTINLTDEAQTDPLLKDLPVNFRAFAGHKEACQELPRDATLLASSANCPIHMLRLKRNIYATQFHPELDKESLALRIRFYRHAGYFPPEDAEKLIAASEKETVTVPKKILRRFVERYSMPV